MNTIIDLIKVAILSIVEGITEFLPVSSTGHLIIANEFIELQPADFANAFSIIIQLGAILSVVVVFFDRLNPISEKKLDLSQVPASYKNWSTGDRLKYRIKHYDPRTIDMWKKVIVGILPAAVLGLLFDDIIDQYLMRTEVVIITLFVYGVLLILIENWNKKRNFTRYKSTEDFTYKTAFIIGCFQCLAMVPGTSRSAATIIGAMLLGSSRVAATEFSFFLAIPTMVGATFLKVVKNLGSFSTYQWFLIAVGFVLSFIVAYVVIRKFLSYVQNNDFKVFGWYRIILAGVLFVLMVSGILA